MAKHDAKINEQDVRDIRRLISEGVPNIVLANKYGLSRQAISDIKAFRCWKHVK